MTYITSRAALQEPLDTFHLPRISPDGRQIPSVAEYCELMRRTEAKLTYSQLRQHIIQDYELGFVSARDTMQRLKDNDLYGDAETFVRIFAAGVKALQEGTV